ncbi:glycosyltransferase [Danxiaibacter flavus]|uniref:Glycosyltransferase n=1 Tax=Danxiaibacter flavus TaxID=3049108 RepID=A0ABV3ZN92_9BACT|nr:glycosyltransferase [Chitinophagaceae bacterium DXS]
MRQEITVVIPVYGQWQLVQRNIDSLLTYEKENIKEIIIIDDCSKEPNTCTINDGRIKIFKTPVNLGYTGTVNFGLKKVRTDIIVLLDSDAYVKNAFIEKLLAYYDDKTVGCVGFATTDDDGYETGSHQYEPTVAGLVMGQAMEFKFSFLRSSKNILPYSCAVSFRRSCLEDLNYFDDTLFKVLEADNDLCMRIHRSKWKLLFTKDIVICHKGGNSYKIDSERVLLFYQSRWNLLKKHRQIKSPAFVKRMMQLRVLIEIVVLKLLVLTSNSRQAYQDKLNGRKLLLKQIALYN